MKTLIPLLFITHLGFFAFAFEFSYNPIIWTVSAFLLNLFITRGSAFANIDDHKPDNDATNTIPGVIAFEIIIILIFVALVWGLGFELSF